MSAEVLVIAEHNGSEVDPVTFDLLSWGAQIAAENHWRVGVLITGFEVGNFRESFRNHVPIQYLF
jgi:hypothetical protein